MPDRIFGIDSLSPKQRSELMAKIRSKGSRVEREFRALLRGVNLTPSSGNRLCGKPDFVFLRARVAIFIDFCFWHGCRWHCRMPNSNQEYWNAKISANKKRDREVTRHHRQAGWTVLRIWEHSLRKDPLKCLSKVRAATAGGWHR
jgi:DNA mismatch endonuclease (patch repair protein)